MHTPLDVLLVRKCIYYVHGIKWSLHLCRDLEEEGPPELPSCQVHKVWPLTPPPLKKKQKTTKQKNNGGHSHYYSQQKLKFLFIRKRLLKIYEKPFVNFDFEIDNPFWKKIDFAKSILINIRGITLCVIR